MTIMLEDLVWYMNENRVHSAPVLSIMTVANAYEPRAVTEKQKVLYTPFGPTGTFVATVHGILPIDKVFKTKEELLASL